MIRYLLLFLIIMLFPVSSPLIKVYLCPNQNCDLVFKEIFVGAKTITCAFYDLDLTYYDYILSTNATISLLLEKDNVFNEYNFLLDKNPYYMHNKFCIINNEIVLTGSTNPTLNGLTKNDNAMVLIKSKAVAKSFQNEFNELTGNKTTNQNDFGNLKVYFCPENNCEQNLISELKKAKKSIYFATFSFTSKPIATELILLKNKGIKINGVIETRMATNSVYPLLFNQGINISKDTNPATMHHKLFVIDNSTLIIGSYNPTNNGNKKNDENMLIMTNLNLSSSFLNSLPSFI